MSRRVELTEVRLEVLLLLHRFAPVTRRVIEYAYSLRHPGEQAVARLRDELAYLRGKGLIGRFQTADAPRGVIDVIYTLTPVGLRDFVTSKKHGEEQSRWGGIERVRPELGSALDRLELILSPRTDFFRLIEFDFLAGRGRRATNESSPVLQIMVEHRESDEDPWARRRVYYVFEFDSPDSPADAVARLDSRYNLASSKTREQKNAAANEPPISGRDTAVVVLVARNQVDKDRFIELTRKEGRVWRYASGLLEVLGGEHATGTLYLTSAERWSEIRPLLPTSTTPARSVIVLRHPELIHLEILGL